MLEEAYLDFEAVSGSSASAMNAVALAHGLAEAGREGAKKTLETLWTAIGASSRRTSSIRSISIRFAPSSRRGSTSRGSDAPARCAGSRAAPIY
ncbi:MAG TPA: hypothetical protein VH278_14520 [Burkholderiaceae bacterium]|nr:hypothetical protein [Burkholderiaceae bacterium]